MSQLKTFYRQVFNKDQRDRIYVWRTRVNSISERIGSVIANALPCRLKVFLKSHLNIHKPMDYSKERILLDISSHLELTVRTKSCVKEPETVMWIEKFFKPSDVFWDVGANVGAYSLVAVKYTNGAVKTFSFEPSFLNFHQLCKNIALNGCGDSITPINIALSEKTSFAVFNYQNLTAGGALHNLGEAIDFKNEVFVPCFKQNIMSISMDDLVRIFHVPVPNHLKLDVDGIEAQILRGGMSILKDARLKSVLLEISEHDMDLIDLLTSAGFRVHERYAQGPEDIKMFNYIFVK